MAEKPDKDVTDVQRRDSESQWMLRLELPGGGRAKRKIMDVLEEDMKSVGVREEDAEDEVQQRTPEDNSKRKKKFFKSMSYE